MFNIKHLNPAPPILNLAPLKESLMNKNVPVSFFYLLFLVTRVDHPPPAGRPALRYPPPHHKSEASRISYYEIGKIIF